jgi:aminoglycoside 3-N-acetyltransferase
MVSYRDLITSFRKLEPNRSLPVIVHASLHSFGEVHGGAETVVGALLTSFDSVIAPTFTYKTMLTPETGPDGNAMAYGSAAVQNKMVEFYTPDMKVDRMMGIIPETLRKHPKAKRSFHPILSFAGVNADSILEAQTIDEPLAPVRKLYEAGGLVLLLGVGQTVNTSIHYGERLAKRKQFVRWALTPEGVIECPGFPGCSEGFDSLEQELEKFTRCLQVGNAQVKAIPVRDLVDGVRVSLAKKPQALLCYRTECERCNAVRLEDKR